MIQSFRIVYPEINQKSTLKISKDGGHSSSRLILLWFIFGQNIEKAYRLKLWSIRSKSTFKIESLFYLQVRNPKNYNYNKLWILAPLQINGRRSEAWLQI